MTALTLKMTRLIALMTLISAAAGCDRKGEITRSGDNLPVKPKAVRSLTFSPDGKLLVAGRGRAEPSEILIWDIEKRKASYLLEELRNGPQSVVFSPNGKYLATGTAEGRIHIWNMSAAQEHR